MSGAEFMSRASTGTLTKPKLDTVEAKVKDWLERATPVRLHAKMGRWNGSEEVPNPPELEETFIKNAERELERENYYSSLTEEDRNKEMKRLLNQLSADGLVALTCLHFLIELNRSTWSLLMNLKRFLAVVVARTTRAR